MPTEKPKTVAEFRREVTRQGKLIDELNEKLKQAYEAARLVRIPGKRQGVLGA